MIGAALISVSDVRAAAGSPQSCTVGATCTVGEFLYDDAYAPISTATCDITGNDPVGASYLDIDDITGSSAGWYSHEFTAPSAVGFYPTEMCCDTADSQHLCMDKSFEVAAVSAAPTTEQIAVAVWGYSSRTMSGFGTLASDVWGNSTRTLSGFGNLVSDLWGNSTRSLTKADLASGSLATKSDVGTNTSTTAVSVANTEKIVTESRLLLEQVVNKPVIQNFIEEVSDPQLNMKINEAKTIADQLDAQVELTQSRVGGMIAGWPGLTEEEREETLAAISQTIGEETDGPAADSVFGELGVLKKTWSWDELVDLTGQAAAVKQSLSSFERTKKFADMNIVSAQVAAMAKLMNNLLEKVQTVTELSDALDARQVEAENLLAHWQSGGMRGQVEALTKVVLAVNRVPEGAVALESRFAVDSQDKKLKNTVLGARALVISNKKMLISGMTGPLVNMWVEEGSMVFKSLVTNPSNLISQTVEVKYYLPSEVKKEDIIETDSELTIAFDTEKNLYYVAGKILLYPGESRVLAVRVADVWTVTKEEIQSVRRQAEALAKPLEKTAYFAQGVTIKSDIDVTLNKVEALLEKTITPEQKIRSYREATLEMQGITVKVEKLKELVTLVSSSGNFMGFVGGGQAVGAWGLTIIFLVGFVFLSLYMRVLLRAERSKRISNQPVVGKSAVVKAAKKNPPGSSRNILKLMTLTIVSAVVSGGILIAIVSVVEHPQPAFANAVSGAEVKGPSDCGLWPPDGQGIATQGADIVRLLVPLGGSVNVRQTASVSSSVVVKAREPIDVFRLAEDANWAQVALDDYGTKGWVSKEFIVEPVQDAGGK